MVVSVIAIAPFPDQPGVPAPACSQLRRRNVWHGRVYRLGVDSVDPSGISRRAILFLLPSPRLPAFEQRHLLAADRAGNVNRLRWFVILIHWNSPVSFVQVYLNVFITIFVHLTLGSEEAVDNGCKARFGLSNSLMGAAELP